MLGIQVFKYVEQTETLYCSKSNLTATNFYSKWDHIAIYRDSIPLFPQERMLSWFPKYCHTR